ncbi:ABC transporter substrate-binding protein [Streptomyces sp. NBC_01795]|uniref:ABC transporter substrate-binding protein n=1 Tax=unclassified Streptomyces TaxID=2593676 RepID=UPI003FA378A2
MLNARGGLNGRKVEVVTCDDGGSGVGSKECVQRLLDKDPAKRVFALVAGASLDYAGAKRVSEAGVRDIGGRPVGPAYDTYPHLYGIYGSLAPRDGRRPGWGEKVHGGTEVYRCFKREQGASKAAVVSYDQSASTGYARLVTRGLKEEGYDVIEEQGDFALPNFRAVAADLRAQKVDLVTFDAMETHGNAQLCEAIDGAGVRLTAKVTNRKAMKRTEAGRERLSPRQFEGWAAAMWFSDAAKSCGDRLTRPCVERFMERDRPYATRGLLLPVTFGHRARPPKERRTCLSVARWRDGKGRQGPTGAESRHDGHLLHRAANRLPPLSAPPEARGRRGRVGSRKNSQLSITIAKPFEHVSEIRCSVHPTLAC